MTPRTLSQTGGLLNLTQSFIYVSADTCLYSYHLSHISRAPFLVCQSQLQEFASWNSIYFPPGSVASKSLHPPLGWEKEMNLSSFDVCYLPGWCYQQLSKRIRKNETDQSYTWHDIFDYGKMFCLNLGYPIVLKDPFFQSFTQQLIYFGQELFLTTQDNGCVGDWPIFHFKIK